MHKNRIIIILGILILFMPELGFTPSTKKFLIQLFAAIVVILAFLIERKGFFAILWHKKNTITPVARTFVEHNGSTPTANPIPDPISAPVSTIENQKV